MVERMKAVVTNYFCCPLTPQKERDLHGRRPTAGSCSTLTNRMCVFVCTKGWRPRRTVVFASWDAEEFGLLGSTEWAEVGSYAATIPCAFSNLDQSFPHLDRTMQRCCKREPWPTSMQTRPLRVSVFECPAISF